MWLFEGIERRRLLDENATLRGISIYTYSETYSPVHGTLEL